MNSSVVTLLCFDPKFDAQRFYSQHPELFHSLRKITVTQSQTNLHQQLAALFQLPELPCAALHAYQRGFAETQKIWMRADPLHLLTDVNQVYFTPRHQLQLHHDEATHLLADLNAFLTNDNMTLLADGANWLLELPQLPQITTHNPDFYLGENIHDYFVSGPEAGTWRTLFTEIQMFLYQHEVNQKRRQNGQVDINALWFWGQGRLPTALSTELSQVMSDEPLSQACATLAGLPVQTDFHDTEGDVLCVMQSVDANTLSPLFEAFKNKQFNQLNCYFSDRSALCLNEKNRKKWWQFR